MQFPQVSPPGQQEWSWSTASRISDPHRSHAGCSARKTAYASGVGKYLDAIFLCDGQRMFSPVADPMQLFMEHRLPVLSIQSCLSLKWVSHRDDLNGVSVHPERLHWLKVDVLFTVPKSQVSPVSMYCFRCPAQWPFMRASRLHPVCAHFLPLLDDCAGAFTSRPLTCLS